MKYPQPAINNYEAKNFLTFDEEHIILASRQHWVVLLWPVVSSVFLTLFLWSLCFFFFFIYLSSFSLFIASFLVITSLTVSYLAKIVTDWYCHIYIVTNRKIMEVRHVPFFSYSLNDLMLDQVRIVEIDIQTGTVLNELMNIGDVVIVFDKLSHEEVFKLSSIHDPRTTGIYLINSLQSGKYQPNLPSRIQKLQFS